MKSIISKHKTIKGFLFGLLIAVIGVAGISSVFASTALVATSYLNIDHNSTAYGSYRKYSKNNQFVDYYWSSIENGGNTYPTLSIELQKKTWFGLNYETVGSDVITTTVSSTYDQAQFYGVGPNNNYRLYHSTWGNWGAGTGKFVANTVNIYTAD